MLWHYPIGIHPCPLVIQVGPHYLHYRSVLYVDGALLQT